MLRSPSKSATAVLLTGTALSLALASPLLLSCKQTITVGADPDTLEFAAQEFADGGPVTKTTTVCYTGPGQASCTAQVPAPFTLGTDGETTSEQFSLTEGSCHELSVTLAEPASLEERLEIAVASELLNGTAIVNLLSSAPPDSGGDDGGSDDGGTDSGGTDGGTDDGGTDDGGTDSGGTDDGGTDTGGGGDTGAGPATCPPYSGLNSPVVRTYETSETYTSTAGLTGTLTISVEDSDTTAPVLVRTLSVTDRADNTTETTERQYYTCDETGSTLVKSEVSGNLLGGDGSTTPIARTDTYSDGMISMVPGFDEGASVADLFTLERDEDDRTTTISGSNVVTSRGAATTSTPAGSFATIQARIQYSLATDADDYTAYLDEELGMVKSFYWDLVSVE